MGVRLDHDSSLPDLSKIKEEPQMNIKGDGHNT